MFQPKTTDITIDYEISEQVLGDGANGKVKLCENRKTKEKCAFKVLNDNPKSRNEIDLLWRAGQGCDYIVQIKDVYENITASGDLKFWVVMECLEGGELFSSIVKRNKEEKKFTEKEVAQMMYQICSAIKRLHDMGIAHRDLKPENLLLSSKDSNAIIKLIDFGYAKEQSSGLKTPLYTPYYVAPEVLHNIENRYDQELYDLSCDIWSLGVIMYILCCGYPPFAPKCGSDITPGMSNRIMHAEYKFHDKHWKNVSKEAKELIRCMLQSDPEDRWTITQIINSDWISKHNLVPNTPLETVDELAKDTEIKSFSIRDGINMIRNGLENMVIKLKDVSEEDPIDKRRKLKKEASENTLGSTEES